MYKHIVLAFYKLKHEDESGLRELFLDIHTSVGLAGDGESVPVVRPDCYGCAYDGTVLYLET